MQSNRRWIGWLGGLAMLAICVVPSTLLAIAAGDPMTLPIAGGKDSGISFDYGLLLSAMPGALATGLLAPLVGYRRRVALWFVVPPVNLYYAWVIGARASQLGTPLARKFAPQRPFEGRAHSGASPALGRRAEDLIREGLKR